MYFQTDSDPLLKVLGTSTERSIAINISESDSSLQFDLLSMAGQIL